MAILCTRCGSTLPRDNVRFCNHCGAIVPQPPQPANASSPSASPPSLPVPPPSHQSIGPNRPSLREQIAHQPPTRPMRRSTPDEPPSWMSLLENETRRKPPDARDARQINQVSQSENPPEAKQVEPPQKLSEAARIDRLVETSTVSWPIPDLPKGKREPTSRDATPLSARTQDVPVPAAPEQPVPPSFARELRVKVWEQEEPVVSEAQVPLPTQEPIIPPFPEKKPGERVQQQPIEEAPTGPLELSALKSIANEPTRPLVESTPPSAPELVIERQSTPPPRREPPSHLDEVAQLDTVPMMTPRQLQKQLQFPQPPQVSRPTMQSPQQGFQVATVTSTSPAPPLASPQKETPPVSIPIPPVATDTANTKRPAPKRRSGLIWLLVCVCLLVLAGAGVGAWVVVFHPFSVDTITQPQQSFSDATLGISLSYPTGWMTQVDHQKLMASFSDSTHTAQINLSIVAGGDASKYVQQEVTKLGMTGATPGTATFAGATWNFMRGEVQQDGANYTETVFATMHGNRLFAFIQLAPQKTYDDEERLVFSLVRSSLQFLS